MLSDPALTLGDCLSVLVLNLGVEDQPYLNDTKTKKAITTHDVSVILEKKYHVMQTFFNIYEDEIIEKIEQSLESAFNVFVNSGQQQDNPFAKTEHFIDAQFKDALARQIFDGLIDGVPTLASLMGVSSRFESGDNNIIEEVVGDNGKIFKVKKTGVPRPSFIDTGLYQTSFKSWFEAE